MTMDYNDYDFEEMGYSNYDSEEESVGLICPPKVGH